MRKHKNETPSPLVSVSNCNLELLQWLQKKMGSGDIRKKKRAKKHHSMAYELRIRGNKALHFLNEVKDLLRVKKPQALLITKHYKALTIRNGRYSPDLLKRKMQLVRSIRKLNQR